MAPSRGLSADRLERGGKRSKVPTLFLLLALSFCVQCLLSSSQGRMQRWKEMRAVEVAQSSRKETLDGDVDGVWRRRQGSDGASVQNEGEDGGSGTLLNIDYQGWYDSVPTTAKPFALALLVLWAFTLFATIGITASDFFCPNLATVADRLGMNESTAGVTFLAFGNGSPDVFSTFSALSSGSFSLAIGELLGASTFIVSVVIGSMALVQPFHVPRWPFIRDVGFFTIAVSILVACLADGKLTLWESGGLVGMYVGYVAVVVGGNWIAGRRRRRADRALERAITMDEQTGGLLEQWRDDDEDAGSIKADAVAASRSILTSVEEQQETEAMRPVASTRSRASQDARSPSLLPHPRRLPLARQRSNSKGWPQRPPIPDTPLAHFSLLGAIEFRDAVNALRKESAAAAAAEAGEVLPSDGRLTPQLDDFLGEPAMDEYFGPISPFTSGHYHSHAAPGARSRTVSPGLGRLRSASHVATPRNPLRLSPLNAATEGSNGRPPPVGRAQSATSLSPKQTVRKAVSLHEVRRASADVVHILGKPSIGISPATPPASGDVPVLPASGRMPGAVQRGSDPRLTLPVDSPARSTTSTRACDQDTEATTEIETAVSLEDRRDGDSGRAYTPHTRKRTRARNVMWAILHTLFPSMHGFKRKSFAGMFLALLASPAILALTLTLPVVDDCAEGLTLNMGGIALEGDEDEQLDLNHAENGHANTEAEAEVEDERHLAGDAGRQLHHLAMTGGLPSPSASAEHDDMKGYMDDPAEIGYGENEGDAHVHLLYNNYLLAAQCVFGTLFCSYAIFSGMEWGNWATLGLGLTGAALGIAVLMYGEDGQNPLWRLLRCFAGFFAAMVWISAIADEMVQVLLTFGIILGLSEAIIGLTIFAIGASMADLISNLTVAKIAPAMSHAACYGGPLLNCLLGIGGAGTYAGLTTNRAYPVHFSHTLWVSAIGLIFILISTLIYVPWNGYYISRSWAVFLISVYVVLTTINIIVEIKA